MDLRITSANNFFSLKGALTKRNIHFFQDEFREVFKSFNTLTVSVEDLEVIDKYGVNAIHALHEQSLQQNVKLAIVGLGCKELYDHFKSCEAA